MRDVASDGLCVGFLTGADERRSPDGGHTKPLGRGQAVDAVEHEAVGLPQEDGGPLTPGFDQPLYMVFVEARLAHPAHSPEVLDRHLESRLPQLARYRPRRICHRRLPYQTNDGFQYAAADRARQDLGQ